MLRIIFSLITVNEVGGGDQDQSVCMQLNEGEMSNISVFNDPNETQLPTGILKFPVNEIMEGFNEEVDQDLYVNRCEPHTTSPSTPTDMISNRLKEYENLMEDLKASTRQKVEAHIELIKLKRELTDHLRLHQESKANLDKMESQVNGYITQVEQLQTEVMYWKSEVNQQEHNDQVKLAKLQDEISQFMTQVEQLQNEVIYWKTDSNTKEHNESGTLKTKLAESNAILEDLRIKYGQAKERLRESMRENVALKTSKVKKKEAEKGLEQLCMNYQDEIEELKRKLLDQAAKVEADTKQHDEKLKAAFNSYDTLQGMIKYLYDVKRTGHPRTVHLTSCLAK